MIRVFTLHPSLLNLNGDQANGLVLMRRANWAGFELEIVPVTTTKAMADALDYAKHGGRSFVLIGHGSVAAMNSLKNQFAEFRLWVSDMIAAGSYGLAVGSGYELVAPTFNRGERLSDYANVELEGFAMLQGYVNTDTDLPKAEFLSERFLVTMVHGPVLARNPKVADFFLEGLGVKLNNNYRAAEVDALVEAINAG